MVLILVDTLRRDFLGGYGSTRAATPHLDRFSRIATRYDDVLAVAPWTAPSVAALLSSRYPAELGMKKPDNPLPDFAELLPEILKREGYWTAGVVSHGLVGRGLRFDQGYDRFVEHRGRRPWWVSGEPVTASARELLESRPKDRPFFLLLHYFDPHSEYVDHEATRSSPGFPQRSSTRGGWGPAGGRVSAPRSSTTW